ncbi:MAG: glycosyltransferase family 2 protein [Pyrinomonadaceae bacterium]|nr:glycosyltransferase family 2 protein [Pyrinomonadaceae bacterium]
MQAIIERKSVRQGARPSVSVVMPVRNALPFLDASIESILNQNLKDFEFIILDDASTDGTTERLREWAERDDRIRLYESREKIDPSLSANFIVRQARSSLVARMDADDISHPDRLMRQFEVMRSCPDVAMVGTLFEGIDVRGRRVRRRDRWRLKRKSVFPPFPHGSVMFRREIFEEVGGYRLECDTWEDQDLFLRIRKRARVVVITDALYYYRFHAASITSNRSMKRIAHMYSVRERCLKELLRGQDYTHVLKEAVSNGHGNRQTSEAIAYALYLRGSIRLWAGQSPDVVRQLFEYKTFGLGTFQLRTLVWATWGWLSPRSLRFFLRSFMGTRDFLASYSVKDGGIHEWRLE